MKAESTSSILVGCEAAGSIGGFGYGQEEVLANTIVEEVEVAFG